MRPNFAGLIFRGRRFFMPIILIIMKYKSMYKCELADAAGVSRQTFYNWTLTDQDILELMGVARNAKMLPPCAVQYLCEKYQIFLE